MVCLSFLVWPIRCVSSQCRSRLAPALLGDAVAVPAGRPGFVERPAPPVSLKTLRDGVVWCGIKFSIHLYPKNEVGKYGQVT